MKLNVKKFLSMLCVVGSVSGLFASNCVSASGIGEDDLDFFDTEVFRVVVPRRVADPAAARINVINLIRGMRSSEMHSGKWYQSVMNLRNLGDISSEGALILILFRGLYFIEGIEPEQLADWVCQSDLNTFLNEVKAREEDYMRTRMEESPLSIILFPSCRELDIVNNCLHQTNIDVTRILEDLNPYRA